MCKRICEPKMTATQTLESLDMHAHGVCHLRHDGAAAVKKVLCRSCLFGAAKSQETAEETRKTGYSPRRRDMASERSEVLMESDIVPWVCQRKKTQKDVTRPAYHGPM